MSAEDVIRSLDALEQLLQAPSVDGHAIAAWREGYDAALAAYTDRGPEWPPIQARARQLALRLDRIAQELLVQQSEIRKERAIQARGTRALRAYKPV